MTTRDQLQRSELDKIALFVAQLQHEQQRNNDRRKTVPEISVRQLRPATVSSKLS